MGGNHADFVQNAGTGNSNWNYLHHHYDVLKKGAYSSFFYLTVLSNKNASASATEDVITANKGPK